jgi:hypothetical protein
MSFTPTFSSLVCFLLALLRSSDSNRDRKKADNLLSPLRYEVTRLIQALCSKSAVELSSAIVRSDEFMMEEDLLFQEFLGSCGKLCSFSL